MIKIISAKIAKDELRAICLAHFKTMAKFVVDIEKKIIAIGGEMHADAEALLLQEGSKQSNLWGGNIYPWNEPESRLEYTSFINIRPMENNTSMEILDKAIKVIVRELVETLVLSPDENIEAAE